MTAAPTPAPDRVGVEIGGTFTDLVMAAPDGTLFTGKIPSTPAAPETAVLGVLEGLDVMKGSLRAHSKMLGSLGIEPVPTKTASEGAIGRQRLLTTSKYGKWTCSKTFL